MTTDRQRVGKRGEWLAKRHLEANGYHVLEANYRAPSGEIDLVAEKGGTLVFVEVRTRTGAALGSPEESVTSVKRAHLVAGFGRIHWVGGDKVLVAASEALQAAEADIIEHMNSDHADALQLYAAQLDDQDGEGWIMTGIDGEGCDLRSGGKVSRVAFESLVIDGPSARAELVGLAKKARG